MAGLVAQLGDRSAVPPLPVEAAEPTVLFGAYARALAGIPAGEPVVVAAHATDAYYVEAVGTFVGHSYVLPPTRFAVRVGHRTVHGARYAWIVVPDSALIAEVRWSSTGEVLETGIAQRGAYDRLEWRKGHARLEKALAHFLGETRGPGREALDPAEVARDIEQAVVAARRGVPRPLHPRELGDHEAVARHYGPYGADLSLLRDHASLTGQTLSDFIRKYGG